MKVSEISHITGVNTEVLGKTPRDHACCHSLTESARMMKHIGAMGYIKETDSDEYMATNFSNALTIPIIGDGYPCL
jgi:hypothetical protein